MKWMRYTLLLIVTIFCFNINVLAEDKNEGDTSNDTTQVGQGSWNNNYVGVRISIVSSNKTTIEASKIFLDEDVTGINFCSNNNPKISNNDVTDCWTTNVTREIKSNYLPSKWQENGVNVDLHNFFKNNNYATLRGLISSFTISPGDYILVEPMVKIGSYYGTSYELINSGKINVSNYDGSVFAGSSSNDNALIWNTLYLNENISGLLNYSNVSNQSDRIGCLKSSTCGRGIGVYTYEQLNPTGTIEIYKKRMKDDGTAGALVTGKTTVFNLYKGHGCSGSYETLNVTGSISFSKVPGKYSIKEITEPTNYIKDDTCHNFEVKNGQKSTIEVLNKPTCQLELEEALADIAPYMLYLPTYYEKRSEKLFELYKRYPTLNGLLRIYNPSCTVVKCDNDNIVSGCLTASTTNDVSPIFNASDLACYDEEVYDSNLKLVGFCKNSFALSNALRPLSVAQNLDIFSTTQQKASTFYSSAGRFLIRQVSLSDTPIALKAYDKKLNMDVYSLSPYVAYSQIHKTCYTLKNKEINKSLDKMKTLKVNFGDNDDNNKADNLIGEKLTNITGITNFFSDVSSSLTGFVSPFNKKEYNSYYGYKLNDIYIENISGKTSTKEDTFKYYTKETGIISKLNSIEGVIPFSIVYDDKVYESETCTYTVSKKRIIDPPNKLNIEFRLIDTENPFNRDTNTNWCAFDGEVIENCKYNNAKVTLNIKNRVNSYGRIPLDPNNTQKEPLYKIMLTPSDIKAIRKYNKDNKYDNYELYCNNSGKCTNSFIYSLNTGTLNSYKNNKIKNNYGSINKLLVKNN